MTIKYASTKDPTLNNGVHVQYRLHAAANLPVGAAGGGKRRHGWRAGTRCSHAIGGRRAADAPQPGNWRVPGRSRRQRTNCCRHSGIARQTQTEVPPRRRAAALRQVSPLASASPERTTRRHDLPPLRVPGTENRIPARAAPWPFGAAAPGCECFGKEPQGVCRNQRRLFPQSARRASAIRSASTFRSRSASVTVSAVNASAQRARRSAR